METLAILFFLASMALFITTIVAVIKPRLVRMNSRWKVALIGVASVLVTFITFVLLVPAEDPGAQEADSVAIANTPTAIAPSATPGPTPTPVPVLPTSTPVPPTPTVLPTSTTSVAQSSTMPEPTSRATQAGNELYVQSLYEELQSFKYDPEFHRVGFAICCRFNAWKVKVDKLADQTGLEFSSQFGFFPDDLLYLSQSYMAGDYSSSYVVDMEKRIEIGLADEPQAGAGEGIMISTSSACKTLDVWRRRVDALLSKNYALESAIIDGTDCPRVYQNTIVSGPLATDSFEIDGVVWKFQLAALPDGSELWFSEWDIEW